MFYALAYNYGGVRSKVNMFIAEAPVAKMGSAWGFWKLFATSYAII